MNQQQWTLHVHIRRNLYNDRLSVYPSLPQSRGEVQESLDSVVSRTNRDEELLLENDAENEIVLLSCENNIMCLKTVSRVYMDATFEYCLGCFYRLYIIHGLVNNVCIPLVFALLPDKTSDTYIK
jgi:hypothetical protein